MKMKKLLFLIIILLPLIGKTQARLGSTLADIKTDYPDKFFKIGYSNSGTKYATCQMNFGTFGYYFDSETGLCNICMQVVDNMEALNAQIEVYNKKYVIISETSWKAYLKDGGLIKIKLTYDNENKFYVFYYTN
jgi:outer membrane lipoprotein-sorting protein